jgi:hypothetical protein
MATQGSFGNSGRGSLGPKVAGFLAGLVLCLGLGLMAGVAFHGGGIGDVSGPPPQVYTNF